MNSLAETVVITGIGVVSPLGQGRDAHWAALTSGKTAISDLSLDPADPLPVKRGARLVGFDVTPFLKDRKMARLLGRASGLGFAASHMALADSGLALETVAPERRGLYCQTGMFQVESRDLAPIVEHCCEDGRLSLARFGEKGMHVINPFLPIKTLPNMGLGALSIAFNFQGPNLVAGPFGGQGALLLGAASSVLADHEADVCLVVGGDAPFNMMTLSSLLAMNVLADDAEKGLILGEGGVALVLERERDAVARSANIYARLTSWASAGANLARHGIAIDPEADAWVFEQVGLGLDGHISAGTVAGALGINATSKRSIEQTGYWPGAGLLLDVVHGALAIHQGDWLPAVRKVLVHGADLSGLVTGVRLECCFNENPQAGAVA